MGDGGLVVYTKEVPEEWAFRDFNTNSERPNPKAYRFLASSNFANVTVPYRRNRAVMFTSTLFHNTDSVRFKKGYRNRRINVTFLYGKRGQKVARHPRSR